MTRSAFFKSLATIFAAPSVLKNIDIPAKSTTYTANYGMFIPKSTTGSLFSDLNAIVPAMYEQYRKKYEHYDEFINELQK